MSTRTQITLTDRQYAFLVTEAERTGLSMAELVRRALDSTYRPELRPRIKGYELMAALVRRPDAAAVGRHPRGPRRVLDGA